MTAGGAPASIGQPRPSTADERARDRVRVRLEDVRGIWCLAWAERPLPQPGDVVRLQGKVWRSLPFVMLNRTDAHGRPVARCAVPLIGPISKPYHRLYKPTGWHAPDVLPTPNDPVVTDRVLIRVAMEDTVDHV